MFDAETARLIRQAPALQDVDPLTLPQQLTAIYAELTSLRLRAAELEAAADRRAVLERLQRLGTIYEAVAGTGATGDARRAAAFVSATGHQILGRVVGGMYSRTFPLLGPDAIHPFVAAPLLFLIAEQNADAREAARGLERETFEDVTRGALVETIYDLATERYEEILERADRLRTARVALDDADPDLTTERALYGLCWAGVVHMVAKLLGRARPDLQFQEFETPQATFDRAISLSASEIELPVVGRGHCRSRARATSHGCFGTLRTALKGPDWLASRLRRAPTRSFGRDGFATGPRLNRCCGATTVRR
jgi:hypothetical protein